MGCGSFERRGKMKKFLVLAAVVIAFAVSAFALSPEDLPKDSYTVQEGDTLWALEGDFSGNPMLWRRLVEMNQFLKDPRRTRVDEKGRTIVLVRPGEKLQGLGEFGIEPEPPSLDQMGIGVATSHVVPPMPMHSQPPSLWWLPSWFLWVLTTVLITALGVIYILMRRDPVTAGPAMVTGGAVDWTAADVFRGNAYARATGMLKGVEVRDVVRGRGYGAIRVGDRLGKWHLRLMTGHAVYRAMVRRDDGQWTQEYMLQVCGNDLRMSGMRYVPGFGFRFVPEAVVEHASTPAPTATAEPNAENTVLVDVTTGARSAPDSPQATATRPAATAEPAQTVTATSVATTAEGEKEKEFTFKPEAKGGRPNFVEFKGFESFEVAVKDGKTTVRFS